MVNDVLQAVDFHKAAKSPHTIEQTIKFSPHVCLVNVKAHHQGILWYPWVPHSFSENPLLGNSPGFCFGCTFRKVVGQFYWRYRCPGILEFGMAREWPLLCEKIGQTEETSYSTSSLFVSVQRCFLIFR